MEGNIMKYRPVLTKGGSRISLQLQDIMIGAENSVRAYIKTKPEWNLKGWKITIEVLKRGSLFLKGKGE